MFKGVRDMTTAEELKPTLKEAKEIACEILRENATIQQNWLNRYNSESKMITVPMDVLTVLFEDSIKKGKIKITTCEGLVVGIKGLPEGYTFEVVCINKYGGSLSPEDEVPVEEREHHPDCPATDGMGCRCNGKNMVDE